MSNKYTVRARTLDVAMKRAKEHFGADAIVVETKTVVRRDREGMGTQPQIDLVVMPARPVSPDRARAPKGADYQIRGGSEAAPDNVRRIQEEIERIERLIRSVETASVRLRSLDPEYPLNETLIGVGVSANGLRAIQSDFETTVGHAGPASVDAAQSHLLGLLQCANVEAIDRISGAHVFMGSAGAGKTSLVIKLATELVCAGKRPAVVVASPYHAGDVHRVHEATSALMIESAVARDFDELERMVKLHSDADAILIDTPCPLSRRGDGTPFFDRLRSSELFFKHYVVSLTSDLEFLSAEIDLFQRFRCDYLALSRLDLARRCGRILDLAVSHPILFSFLSWEEAAGPGVALARPETLAALVTARTSGGAHSKVSA